MDPLSLYRNPNALAPSYRRFRVAHRLLMTGHSHQAWPDCSLEAQTMAWVDAAERVDDKWDLAFEKAALVRAGFARLMGDTTGSIALGPSTHDMVVRLLSALPLDRRPRVVTTDGEFHSLRRQLDRLGEGLIDLVKVPTHPTENLAERMAAEVDSRTSVAALSYVFFESGMTAGDLTPLCAACRREGAALLIDAYHALNVVPFSLTSLDLEDAFIVAGGYKYCQMGEGNCFLRYPAKCALRPAITGWFAEFDELETAAEHGHVRYGRGHHRFAGSTYDPTSHYRGAAVFDFFRQKNLTPELLREVSQHQIGLLARTFDDLDLPADVIRRNTDCPIERLGGFLVLTSPLASRLQATLRELDVLTDSRGTSLRFGPAPYLCDDQIVDAMTRLSEAVKLVS